MVYLKLVLNTLDKQLEIEFQQICDLYIKFLKDQQFLLTFLSTLNLLRATVYKIRLF